MFKMPSFQTEYEFDQDVDTDEEALAGSKAQLEEHFESAMREYMAMPVRAASTMLKNASIVSRV